MFRVIEMENIENLRRNIVEEWLQYEESYICFCTSGDFQEEAEHYRETEYMDSGKPF